jgi:quercetin dioxygenase-like cupin family protein
MRLATRSGLISTTLAIVVGGAIGAGIAVAATSTTVVADTNVVRERIATFTTDGGFTTGWHIHPGPVIVQVQDGYLKITQATCHPNVIGPGETYIETPGVPVLSTADKAASWTITEILPNSAPGGPDRVPATSPCTNS